MVTFEKKIYDISGMNLPEKCPSCGGDILVQDNGQVRCANISCPLVVKHKVAKFFKELGIRGVGNSFIERCSKEVKSISDIFLISESIMGQDSFERWSGHGEGRSKNGSKILELLKKNLNKPISISKYLSLMDMEGFSEKRLAIFENSSLFGRVYSMLSYGAKGKKECISFLVENFPRDESILMTEGMSEEMKNSLGEMMGSDRDIISCSIYFKFKSPYEKRNTKNVNGKASSSNVLPNESLSESSSGKLSGKTFCFHGTLSEKRSVLEEMVREYGGNVGAVNKKLSYLVCNSQNDSSSKVRKAKEMNIPMISEEEFKEMIQNG